MGWLICRKVISILNLSLIHILAGQAVPSVTPGIASANLKKIECFCFVRQSLNPGEEKEMPLRFFVSPELPADVSEMTLSYSFFPAVSNSK